MADFSRIVICSDSHGNKRNHHAVSLFKKFCDDFKPALRLHLGDYMDAEALRCGAAEHERRVGLRDDAKEALQFLEWYKPTHLLDGNHDDRLPLYVKHSPGPLADYIMEILGRISDVCAKFKTQRRPYDKRRGVIQIGKLRVLHGFFAGINAPQMHARSFGSCVFGHTHRFSAVSVPGGHSGGRNVARGVGCLCELDMEYNSRQVDTLSQCQGWVYGVMDRRGRYWLHNAEIIEGSVAVTDNFKIFR